MSRLCVPGLIALLAAAPAPWCGADQILLNELIEVDAPAESESESESDEDEEESAARKLSDEETKALDEFISKVAKEKRTQMEAHMKAAVEAVVKETKLEAGAKKKLEAATGKVVDGAMESWQKAFRKYIEPMVQQAGNGSNQIKGWAAKSFQAARLGEDLPPPDESDAWKAVLKETLTPEQLTLRKEAARAAEKKFQEDYGDFLATAEGNAGDQMSAGIESEISRIAQFSGLDEERQKKLKAAGDDAVKECVKAWRRKMENQIKSLPEKQREQMVSRGGMGVNLTDKTYQPKERQVWKDAVASLLKDQERELLERRSKEVRGRRADALAILLVSDLDRLVGFSAEQRTRFLPLASKRLTKLPDHYFVTPDNGGYHSLDPGQMLQQVQKLKDTELQPVFSEAQIKRFREASPDQLLRSSSHSREKLDVGDVPKPEEMDEVEVERVLSQFLHREAKKMKLKMLSVMVAQVEHIGRVVNPAPETVKVLTTAAKGAAEEMAAGSILNLSGWVRGQFMNVKPSDVPARLQNLFNPYFSERNLPAAPRMWTVAVDNLLNEEQRKLWKEEMALREQWRKDGLSIIVVSELEKRIVLADEQREKLQKKIEEVLKTYDEDFNNYFSFGWHLQGYYSLIPVAMFTEKEMEEHFDAKQRTSLKDKALGTSLQYAEMIRQNHKSRKGRKE